MFINERKRNANTYLISNFDSLEAAPFKSTALGSCLVCLGLNSPLAEDGSLEQKYVANCVLMTLYIYVVFY